MRFHKKGFGRVSIIGSGYGAKPQKCSGHVPLVINGKFLSVYVIMRSSDYYSLLCR